MNTGRTYIYGAKYARVENKLMWPRGSFLYCSGLHIRANYLLRYVNKGDFQSTLYTLARTWVCTAMDKGYNLGGDMGVKHLEQMF